MYVKQKKLSFKLHIELNLKRRPVSPGRLETDIAFIIVFALAKSQRRLPLCLRLSRRMDRFTRKSHIKYKETGQENDGSAYDVAGNRLMKEQIRP